MSKKYDNRNSKASSRTVTPRPRDAAPADDEGRASLQRRLMKFLQGRKYQPLDRVALTAAVELAPAETAPFAVLLEELLANGVLVELKSRGGIALADSADLLSGTITFTRSGSAFVDLSEPQRSVFIPAHGTFTALHGDKVLVRLSPRQDGRGRPGDLPEGRVIRILERRRQTLVGTLQRRVRTLFVAPMQAVFSKDIIVPDCGPAQIGDRVLVRLDAWDDPALNPEGEIVEVIGPADDPSLDTLAVIRAFDIADEFSLPTVSEAATATMTEADYLGRLDLRQAFVFTVDPVTARDYDDAISLERLSKGRWQLGVHIADVSHFVRPGSALDEEARRRGTSVYLPDKVVPMLPEQLSNGLCSLHANVDRLCFSALIILNDAAEVLDVSFAETVIHSKYRLNYGQALAVLENREPEGGTLPAELVEKLRQVHRMAQKCRRRRVDSGALMLEIPEVKFQIGPDGRIAGVIPQKDDISHQLIEECMLLANELVCRHLAQKGRAQLYRIHAEPDPESLADLADMFEAAGLPPEDFTDRMRLARFLVRIKDMPAARAWNTNVLRAMKKAEYSTKPVGHYGLAKQFYAHFTSPIRRYPDLVTHRLLKACLTGSHPPYAGRELEETAGNCSAREKVASDAERECVQLKLIRFFKEQLESHNVQEYDAVVVDVRNLGLFVDVPAVQAGGLIKISELGEDFFDFDEARSRLRGRRSGLTYEVGSALKVIIVRVDEARKRLDFLPVGPVQRRARPERSKGPKGAKAQGPRQRRSRRS